MKILRYIVLIVLIISTFIGCEVFDRQHTSHPNDGGINLTVDWSQMTNQPPSVYRARVVAASGATRDFNNLTGDHNLLVVPPGEAVMYVYNEAEQISIAGYKAKVNPAQNPGMFYTYSSQVFTERDKDINHTAVMNQQTGELKISLAIKPADMINKVKTVNATLDGVALELDMQTNELSASSSIRTPFVQSGYYATATIRLFGFDQATRQNLTLNVELENGNKANATADLTSLVSEFNRSKNTLLSLNADLYISNEHQPVITITKWERNAEIRYLSASPLEITMQQDASDDYISIFTDQPSWSYTIVQSANWLSATKSDYQLYVSATANPGEQQRQATVHVSAGGLTENITITQDGYVALTYFDKEVVKLQSATVGKGVNIVLMGDGYTSKDMDKGTGKYEQDMRTAADHFFAVYPYTVYRNYFNVYMVAAISNQEGISNESTGKWVDTKFKTRWEGGRSTGIDCNSDIVIEYLDEIAELEFAYIEDITVVMPINANIYAGTCIMYYYDNFTSDYGNGFSISMCPVSSEFKEIILHEAAGHGFAKLTDEYVYYPNAIIPNEDKNRITMLKTYGWCENVDFYGHIAQTSWKGFANLSNYTMVSAFEGARLYGKGVWRPEYNSCMNNNIPYYNAPSRWAIVRRIMRLAGRSYSFSQFLQDEKIPAYPATLRRYDDKAFIPLAPPVIRDMKEIRSTGLNKKK